MAILWNINFLIFLQIVFSLWQWWNRVKQTSLPHVFVIFREGVKNFIRLVEREMTGNRGLCHPKSIPLLTKHPKQPWFSAGCIHYGVTRGLFLRGRWHESCLRAWDSILMSGWWITYICASLIVELPSFCWQNPQNFGLLKSPSVMVTPGKMSRWNPHFLVADFPISHKCPWNTSEPWETSTHPPLTASDSPTSCWGKVPAG